jgi:hypothetical protein
MKAFAHDSGRRVCDANSGLRGAAGDSAIFHPQVLPDRQPQKALDFYSESYILSHTSRESYLGVFVAPALVCGG